MKSPNRKQNRKRVSSKLGMSPGTLLHIGEQKTDPPLICIINYDSDTHVAKQYTNSDKPSPIRYKEGITWINIDGLHQIDLIEHIGNEFGISRLTLEDILNTNQRPKLDAHENYVYLVVKMLHYPEDSPDLEVEQVSFLLGKDFVISFQESPGDTFNSVRHRLQQSSNSIRTRKADYLLYALLDTIVDNYFVIIEHLSDKTENLEERLLHQVSDDLLNEIYQLRKEISNIRRSIYPLREVIAALDRNDSHIMSSDTKWYIRDVYDHTIQVIDQVENFREAITTMIDLYMSGISNRMNNIMKVLTVISTIFIPLTFIVGLYGMNFDNMPELHWHYGYFIIWGIMITMGLSMFAYFRRKKWF
jgi:magnesium transporter